MDTNKQGLTKEEKVMFTILGMILLVAIWVLILDSFKEKEKNLNTNNTPIQETSGQTDNIKDDNINEPVDVLIEEETEVKKREKNPVVNISSSTGTTNKNQSTQKPKPQPVVLDWTFKDTMVTNAFCGDVITIEKNVLLTNGKEHEANVVIMKYENDSWISVDTTQGIFQVSTGLYKYIYSYGSSTKELLLTVSSKVMIDNIKILTLNEYIEESSTITLEEYTKYQKIIYNSILDTNTLTINNYIDTNNLLPLIITFNEDITNKDISINTLGITITKDQKDWYEKLTPNSIVIWLDLNTMDLTNNIISLEIDGVTYELELNITINPEEISNPEQSELENNQENNQDNNLNENENTDEENNNEDFNEEDEELIEDTNSNEEEQEDDLDPLEPPEEDIEENSSQEILSSEEEQIEENNLQPEINDISTQTS